jgi:phage gpG-like protein
MKSFSSLGAFALHLVEAEVAIAEELHHGLERIAKLIEKTAKAEIGHYQEATGPFPGWPSLADSTEDRKAAMGYPADAPLLASGEMQESISHQVEGFEALIGSPDEKLVFHEFGTSKMDARPVLGPAAFTNKAAIEKLIGAAVVAGLIGSDQIHPALGYDFETKD